MKKICVGKIFILFVVTFTMSKVYSLASASNLGSEISVVNDRSLLNATPIQSVSQHTLPAPYNNVTFTITAPVRVCVGQIFTIDYAIHTSQFTHISYWSDLIPDATQGLPVKIIDIKHPSIGILNSDDPSIAKKGGKGLWVFPKGLPGSTVQHLQITLQATAPGLLKFATIAATNPPFYCGTAGTLVSCNPPTANPISVTGWSDQLLDVYILDYIIGDSALTVTSITNPLYGSAQINDDNTVTYTPSTGFYGNDSLSYKVTDTAGNVIDGIVTITINKSPTPQIIQ